MDTTRWLAHVYRKDKDKPGQHLHQENPQKYKRHNDGSHNYCSEGFHHSLYLDYVLCLEPTGTAGAVPVGGREWPPPGTSAGF
jgi:hypothetical protein